MYEWIWSIWPNNWTSPQKPRLSDAIFFPIQHVYVESHSVTDIHQMAGRIRRGAEHLYVIIDSEGYGNIEHRFERVLAKYLCTSKQAAIDISYANSILKDFCDEHKLSLNDAYRTENSDLGDFIDLIKQKFPYIEFDYFTYKFRFNSYNKLSHDFISSETRSFTEASKVPQDLVALFQRAFPYSNIYSSITPEEEAQQIGWNFLNSHPTGTLNSSSVYVSTLCASTLMAFMLNGCTYPSSIKKCMVVIKSRK